jgi:alanine-glyoxylate transaminase/serine-glyoxylate transaminase/serine-pyruvate transaminase
MGLQLAGVPLAGSGLPEAMAYLTSEAKAAAFKAAA